MKHIIFTEKELEGVFSGKRAKKERGKIFAVFKTFGVFILITVCIFVAFNYGELYKNLTFWYKTNYQGENREAAVNDDKSTTEKIINGLEQDNKNSTKTPPQLPSLADNNLTIPSIDVLAPITWNVPNTTSDTLANLKNGLIHISGTALPGQTGNIFISGHSSNYPWVKSKYNSIFALLDKVVVGDIVHLKYANNDYLYKVSEIKVVQPEDSSVMQSNSSSILTLMTCTPVGTNLRRLIVVANQVYPNPSGNTKASAKNNLTMPKKVH